MSCGGWKTSTNCVLLDAELGRHLVRSVRGAENAQNASHRVVSTAPVPSHGGADQGADFQGSSPPDVGNLLNDHYIYLRLTDESWLKKHSAMVIWYCVISCVISDIMSMVFLCIRLYQYLWLPHLSNYPSGSLCSLLRSWLNALLRAFRTSWERGHSTFFNLHL